MIYKFSTFIVTSLTISVFKTKVKSSVKSQKSKHKTLYFKIVKNKEQTSLIWILDNNYIRVKIIYPSKYCNLQKGTEIYTLREIGSNSTGANQT